MNWRRLLVAACGGIAVALLFAGAFARDPVWMAAGLGLAMSAGGALAFMLSRQIGWLAGELGGARGYIVDKVLTLGAQLKDQRAMLSAHEKMLSGVATLGDAIALAEAERRRRLDGVEARLTELVIGCRRDLLADVEARLESVNENFQTYEQALQRAVADSRREMVAALAMNAERLAALAEREQPLLRLVEETRADVADGANIAMRTFRELGDSLDQATEVLRQQLRQLDGRQEELSAGVMGRLAAILEGDIDVLSELRGLVDVHRQDQVALHESIAELAAGDAGVLSELRVLVDMRRQDRSDLKDFIGDEKRLRKISQLSMQWLKTEILHEIEALSQLRPMLGVEGSTPLLGGWAMDAAAVHALIGVLRERRPLRIVELGSGSSTVWIGHALRKAGHGHLVSFDHIELYGDRTRRALAENALGEVAEVRVRPLVPVDLDGATYQWYDIRDLASLGPIDVLVVDGPPGGTGPMARYPALPLLWSQLAPDALVVVDDATRPDERRMLQAWREAHPELGPPEPVGSRTIVLRRGASGSHPAV